MNVRLRHLADGFTGALCRRAAVALLALSGSWAGVSQAANVTVYTDQATWAAAALARYPFSNGVATTTGLASIGLASVNYYYAPQNLRSLQNSSSAPLGGAFGGNFDLTPGGDGGGLAFQVNFEDGTSEVFWSAVNYPVAPVTYQFWGIVSDTTITSVQVFSNQWNGNGETFNYNLYTLTFPQFRVCLRCRAPIVPRLPLSGG